MKKVVEDPYIWQVPNSLTDEFCDDLIKKFEEDPAGKKYKGIVGNGPAPDLKETYDLVIDNTPLWKNEDTFIAAKVGKMILEYFQHVRKHVPDVDIVNGIINLHDSGYHIQKYEPNKGFYTWHNDYQFQEADGSRILTFIWYLNTVEKGGETEFTNGIKVKAEKGKLVMFPATWTYTHRGCMPYSNEKYILTGWVYNGWTKDDRFA